MNGIILNQSPPSMQKADIEKILGYVPADEMKVVLGIQEAGKSGFKTGNITLSPASVGLKSLDQMFSSPVLSGIPTLSNKINQEDNSQRIASTAYVTSKVDSSMTIIKNYLFGKIGFLNISNIPSQITSVYNGDSRSLYIGISLPNQIDVSSQLFTKSINSETFDNYQLEYTFYESNDSGQYFPILRLGYLKSSGNFYYVDSFISENINASKAEWEDGSDELYIDIVLGTLYYEDSPSPEGGEYTGSVKWTPAPLEQTFTIEE